MQASATLDTAAAAPPASLRLTPPGESVEQTKELSPLPFVVGRSETAGLQIVSNRVSREHAVFHWEEGQFWVRDLGSTNGTFFHGTRIECQLIEPGDTVHIADIAVTLELDELPEGDRGETVAQLRARQELLLHRGVLCGFLPVWDLAEAKAAGCFAVGLEDNLVASASRQGLPTTRVPRQLHWLTLLRAAELAAELPESMPLLIELHDAADAARWLPLIARQANGRPVAARLPLGGLPNQQQLINLIHDAGLKAAVEIEPGGEIVEGVEQCWLSAAFTAQLGDDESLWQPLIDVIELAASEGVSLMALGLADERAVRVCAELDCRWAMGPIFGEPRAACELGHG